MSRLNAKFLAIGNLEPKVYLYYTKQAKQYGFDRRSLARRHQGLKTSREINLSKREPPPTRTITRVFASQVARKEIGPCWIDGFLRKRRYDHLISKWATGMDNSRFKVDSSAQYKLFFDQPS